MNGPFVINLPVIISKVRKTRNFDPVLYNSVQTRAN